MKKIFYFLFIFIVAGCGEDKQVNAPLPEVNEINCLPQNIEKMPSEKQREEFSSLCFKRGDFNKKSPERKW